MPEKKSTFWENLFGSDDEKKKEKPKTAPGFGQARGPKTKLTETLKRAEEVAAGKRGDNGRRYER